ncbi:(Fe-S)-binding protein [Agarivorans sp. MS3-6]|uniref:(Fe-S)-binding protein n=1 Tax=Agarivorans sp. TSD2052 TaxID=2937286 RepID=UPI00200E117E|nr:(Fe-S)-binding protein [Agarivorans sp. TSD2052]UPW17545.1 (Fe-S)-binding protein [Agarivorans sp. TSD2052]
MTQTGLRIYPSKPNKVYFYATCLLDVLDPDGGMAAVELIEREGIEIIWVEKQSCCGQPAYTSGYQDQAKTVALSQIALFPEDHPIVVMSGSCAGMMFKHYPSLFADDPRLHARAQAFSERVYEFSEFLLRVCRATLQDKGEPTSVVLHTSCSGRREMGIHVSSQALLAQLNNVEIKNAAYETECCGFGGSFALRHADISQAMVEDKATHLSQSSAKQLVSADWGCLANINGHLAYRGEAASFQGKHLASFLWQRTADERGEQ